LEVDILEVDILEVDILEADILEVNKDMYVAPKNYCSCCDYEEVAGVNVTNAIFPRPIFYSTYIFCVLRA
jgi:hypothetical protein